MQEECRKTERRMKLPFSASFCLLSFLPFCRAATRFVLQCSSRHDLLLLSPSHPILTKATMLASLRRAASSSSLQPSRSLSVRGIQTWALRRPPSRLAHRLGDRHSVQPQPSAVKRPFHSTTPTRAAISPGGFQFDPRRPLDRTQWNGRTYLLVGGGIAATAYYVVQLSIAESFLHYSCLCLTPTFKRCFSLEQVPATGRWRFMDVSPSRERRVSMHDASLPHCTQSSEPWTR